MIQVTVLKDMQDCQWLQSAWHKLTEDSAQGIFRLGVCMSFEWTMTLWKNNLGGQPQHVLVAEEAGEVLAILPCYGHRSSGVPGLKPLTLSAFSELYYTRAGLLCRQDRPDAIAALLAYRGSACPFWTRLIVSVVEDSPSQQVLDDLLRVAGLRYHTEMLRPSPYLELPSSEEQFFTSLDGYFRKKIRSRERKLCELGHVIFHIYEKPEDIPTMIANIENIERASWKESEGTSITKKPVQQRFYKHFLPKAAEKQFLLLAVLQVDENPIAYQLGLIFNDVFECLKTSYIQEYSRYGLGHILMKLLIHNLYLRGINYCDFQGDIEQSKMNWTDKKYRHIRYVIYQKGVAGRLVELGHQLHDRICSHNRPASENGNE